MDPCQWGCDKNLLNPRVEIYYCRKHRSGPKKWKPIRSISFDDAAHEYIKFLKINDIFYVFQDGIRKTYKIISKKVIECIETGYNFVME